MSVFAILIIFSAAIYFTFTTLLRGPERIVPTIDEQPSDHTNRTGTDKSSAEIKDLTATLPLSLKIVIYAFIFVVVAILFRMRWLP